MNQLIKHFENDLSTISLYLTHSFMLYPVKFTQTIDVFLSYLYWSSLSHTYHFDRVQNLLYGLPLVNHFARTKRCKPVAPLSAFSWRMFTRVPFFSSTISNLYFADISYCFHRVEIESALVALCSKCNREVQLSIFYPPKLKLCGTNTKRFSFLKSLILT